MPEILSDALGGGRKPKELKKNGLVKKRTKKKGPLGIWK